MRLRMTAVRVLTLGSLAILLGMTAFAADLPAPAETVGAFHDALAMGDKLAVLELLDPEVSIFESGGAELSRDEYAGHHLGADMEFAGATSRTVIDQQSDQQGEAAWVLTRSETSGTFRDKEVESLGVESVILRRGEKGWRIIHIHWSSRARRAAR